MAERSKAPVSGTGLFGGVGSNPTPISSSFLTAFQTPFITEIFEKKSAETGNRTQAFAATTRGTAIILSRRFSMPGRASRSTHSTPTQF